VEPDPAVWRLGPSIGRADGPRLCAELAERLRAGAPDPGAPYTGAPYTVDIRGLVGPDLGTVETLARLQLTARRSGQSLRYRAGAGGTGRRLRELVALAGLDAVLPLDLS
jgi:STAS domain